jgi:glutathione synthase/RimK-type ligase-like ATP-grasp enzyme
MAAHFFFMKRIALATSSKYAQLTDDDRLLLAPLAKHGIHAEPAIWDEAHIDWSSYAAVVLRSCWDYHLKPQLFLRWISKLEAAGVAVFNSAPFVRWNADKVYLRDLESKGITIVPTYWSDGPQNCCEHIPITLKDKMHELGWHRVVIKPRISATAHGTLLVSTVDAEKAQSHYDELRRSPGVMVQKFIQGIASEGEWSLMFFAGRFNHAVLKRPRNGDFRVQNDFGGTSQLGDPPPNVLAVATRAVHAIEATVYARVDGVVEDGQFHLMELELIEPALFLADHPEAPGRFADAISRALDSRPKRD